MLQRQGNFQTFVTREAKASDFHVNFQTDYICTIVKLKSFYTPVTKMKSGTLELGECRNI